MDMNLVRLVMAAEMLKPVTPTVSSEDKTVTEYFPHLVIVHNKAEFPDTQPASIENIEALYSRVLSKSRQELLTIFREVSHFHGARRRPQLPLVESALSIKINNLDVTLGCLSSKMDACP